MVRAHTEAEKKALPPPLSMLGCSTAAHSINLHKLVLAGQLLGCCVCPLIESKAGALARLELGGDRASGTNLSLMKPKQHIHRQSRFLTIFVLPGMMYYFDNFTQPALLYTLLHSIYCACWLSKHMTFRDKNFDEKSA